MKKKNKFPIFVKCTVLIALFSIILGAVALFAFGSVLRSMNKERFDEIATTVSRTVADTLDVERFVRVRDAVLDIYEKSENKPTSEEMEEPGWDEYIDQFGEIEESEDFLIVRESVRKIQNNNPVDCAYLTYVDRERANFIYIVDAALEDACTPGTIDPVYEMNRKILADPYYGFPAYTTNTEAYGELVTAGVPIVDKDGQVVGYAMTDITLSEVRAEERSIILKMMGILAAAVVVIIDAAVTIVSFAMIRPLKKLTKAADTYAQKDEERVRHAFAGLNIRTYDEFEELSVSIQNMENNINRRIEELYAVNERLAASQNLAEEMSELANKDGLTGVKNITAYNRKVRELEEVMKEDGDMRFAVVMIDLNDLKKTNDVYGHGSGDEAIKGLSSTVCSIFKHSPVYRIGGDEFAVIVQGQDLENLKDLFGALTEQMDRLYRCPAESAEYRMAAAAGYAEYAPGTGDSYDEVFRRADEAMYQRKRGMKKKKN